MQITNTVLMIRPVRFRMNEQTAVNNYFQEKIDTENQQINHQAQQEFDTFVPPIPSSLTIGFLSIKTETLPYTLCLPKIAAASAAKIYLIK